MNFQEMLINAVNSYRQYEQKNQLESLPETRFKNAFVELDVALATLADDLGWFVANADRKMVDHEAILRDYVRVIRLFLLVANLRNWNRDVLVDDKQLAKLNVQFGKTDYSKIYLAIKNMIYAAYFKHNQVDFNHAWKLILKLGLADLKLKPDDIKNEFDRQTQLTPIDYD
ncbi:hypothetical protein [Nicoliella lavandulae]|uniref:dUTPase n=1 Tax=Nicoliella lavandulae TaxID=3082954 RepID=A0ABU8SL08_9LACO